MIGSIIGAGASLLGGLLGSKEKEKDRKLQKEFAQTGIQWKVEDAKKAGIHPLYALGANTTSFSPVSVGGSDLGSGIAAAGQDISRAVNAASGPQQRLDAYNSTVQALGVEKMSLENDLLRSQIAKINQAGMPPAMPSATQRYLVDGQAPTVLVKEEPLKRVAGDPGNRALEPGAVADVGFTRTTSGGFAPVMSNDAKERLEEDWPGMILWNMRNRLLPTFGMNQSPPQAELPKGYDVWVYNPFRQEYTPHKRGWFGVPY